MTEIFQAHSEVEAIVGTSLVIVTGWSLFIGVVVIMEILISYCLSSFPVSLSFSSLLSQDCTSLNKEISHNHCPSFCFLEVLE